MFWNQEEIAKQNINTTLTELPPSKQSTGQLLLQSGTKEIKKITQTAQEILKYADGLVLPGGEHVEPSFYNASAPRSINGLRTVMEMALIAEAEKQKMQTLGICRGSQVINVFHGGTLENVKSRFGRSTLEWTAASHGKELRQVLPEQFESESFHFQAAAVVGKGLEVVLQKDSIPKMLVNSDETIIASQVHPETYMVSLKRLTQLHAPFPQTGDIKEVAVKIAEKIQEIQSRSEISPWAKKYCQSWLGDLQEHAERPVVSTDLSENPSSEGVETIRAVAKELILALQEQQLLYKGEANLYCERLKKIVQSEIKEVDYIVANRAIYTFFIERVKRHQPH